VAGLLHRTTPIAVAQVPESASVDGEGALKTPNPAAGVYVIFSNPRVFLFPLLPALSAVHIFPHWSFSL